MLLTKAGKSKAKIKMGLQGPSGSGKTLSALLIAFGMTGSWESIAVIDTENGSSNLYANEGPFKVLDLKPPFTPERYKEALDACLKNKEIEVVIIDSISHEWDGEGGILEVHSNMTGNSFTNWGKIMPRHNSLIQKILQSNVHVIATIRSKQDWVLSEKNGKMVPEKVGLKGITKEGLDYEFTLVFDLDIKHYAQASKDRTRLFMDHPQFQITPGTGKLIKKWCQTESVDKDQIMEAIMGSTSIEELHELYKLYPDYQEELKDQFTKKRTEIETSIQTPEKQV